MDYNSPEFKNLILRFSASSLPQISFPVSASMTAIESMAKALATSVKFDAVSFSTLNAIVEKSTFATIGIPSAVQQAMKNITAGAPGFSDAMKNSMAPLHTLAGSVLDEDFDDYVTTIESPIQELKLPDTIAVPIGHNRIRMSTSIFIAFISFMLATIISITSFVADRVESSSNANETAQLLEYEKTQTAFLSEILNALDTSNSSHKEDLEDIRSAFRTQ